MSTTVLLLGVLHAIPVLVVARVTGSRSATRVTAMSMVPVAYFVGGREWTYFDLAGIAIGYVLAVTLFLGPDRGGETLLSRWRMRRERERIEREARIATLQSERVIQVQIRVSKPWLSVAFILALASGGIGYWVTQNPGMALVAAGIACPIGLGVAAWGWRNKELERIDAALKEEYRANRSIGERAEEGLTQVLLWAALIGVGIYSFQQHASKTRAAEEARLQRVEHYERIKRAFERRYPQLDQRSQGYDAAIAHNVYRTMQTHESRGDPPVDALIKAVMAWDPRNARIKDALGTIDYQSLENGYCLYVYSPPNAGRVQKTAPCI